MFLDKGQQIVWFAQARQSESSAVRTSCLLFFLSLHHRPLQSFFARALPDASSSCSAALAGYSQIDCRFSAHPSLLSRKGQTLYLFRSLAVRVSQRGLVASQIRVSAAGFRFDQRIQLVSARFRNLVAMGDYFTKAFSLLQSLFCDDDETP
jgi:hypothetical protein